MKKVLTGSIRREMALEEHCAKQAAEIMQLNRLVEYLFHFLDFWFSILCFSHCYGWCSYNNISMSENAVP